MRSKSVEEKILDFFYNHPGEQWHSGELQRLEWKNANNSVATPRSVVRRLQELCNEGKIANIGTMKEAIYTLKAEPPKKQQIIFKEVNGERIAVLSYV